MAVTAVPQHERPAAASDVAASFTLPKDRLLRFSDRIRGRTQMVFLGEA